ncbi:MAG: YbjN domain-containing protein [Gaiellaceae bacterium]
MADVVKDELRQKLERLLDEIFGSHPTDSEGDFVVPHGSAVAFLRPIEIYGGQTAVRVWAITNVGLDATDDLARYIATENGKLVFGVLSLDDTRGAVVLGHTLLGEFLNREEVKVAVAAVAMVADSYDEEIKARFGGRLFTEPAQ